MNRSILESSVGREVKIFKTPTIEGFCYRCGKEGELVLDRLDPNPGGYIEVYRCQQCSQPTPKYTRINLSGKK